MGNETANKKGCVMKNKNGNTFKKPKLSIPSDWPRPWDEINEGDWVIFCFYILRWKTYYRPDSFKIYGFSKGRYSRIWWGRKVLHYRFKIRRIIRSKQ
tara:strand:+ start:366 stop:659 length:294 start_codon:yes stop_codon:yes gene_type:complete